MTDAKSIPSELLDQLQRLSHPACLIDVPAALAVWANAGARRALELVELGGETDTQNRASWRLDSSSPAFDQLAALQQTDGPTDAAGCGSTNEVLAFKTTTGVKRFSCRCRALHEIRPGLVLITAAAHSTDTDETDQPPALGGCDSGESLRPIKNDEVAAQGTQGTQDTGQSSWLQQSPAHHDPPQRRQSIKLAEADRSPRKTGTPQDMATLQEIARRIREDRRDEGPEYGPEFRNDFVAAGARLQLANDTDKTTSPPTASITRLDTAGPSSKRPVIVVATDQDEMIATNQPHPSDAAFNGMQSATERAEAAGAAPDPMAQLAHELRTPISAIHTAAAIMAREKFGPIKNPRYRTYAQDIELSAAHALEVISGMLNPESLRTGRPHLEFTRVDLDGLIRDTLAAMAPLAEQANLELSSKLAEALPHVIADARAVKQMLLNLLTNAVKFTDPGGRITVTTGFELNGPVRVEVRDSGPGMSQRQIAGIMNGPDGGLQQQRQHRAPKRQGGGLGLGLPLTLSLAQANNAELRLVSGGGGDNNDAGLRATIVFPKDRTLAAW